MLYIPLPPGNRSFNLVHQGEKVFRHNCAENCNLAKTFFKVVFPARQRFRKTLYILYICKVNLLNNDTTFHKSFLGKCKLQTDLACFIAGLLSFSELYKLSYLQNWHGKKCIVVYVPIASSIHGQCSTL